MNNQTHRRLFGGQVNPFNVTVDICQQRSQCLVMNFDLCVLMLTPGVDDSLDEKNRFLAQSLFVRPTGLPELVPAIPSVRGHRPSTYIECDDTH